MDPTPRITDEVRSLATELARELGPDTPFSGDLIGPERFRASWDEDGIGQIELTIPFPGFDLPLCIPMDCNEPLDILDLAQAIAGRLRAAWVIQDALATRLAHALEQVRDAFADRNAARLGVRATYARPSILDLTFLTNVFVPEVVCSGLDDGLRQAQLVVPLPPGTSIPNVVSAFLGKQRARHQHAKRVRRMGAAALIDRVALAAADASEQGRAAAMATVLDEGQAVISSRSTAPIAWHANLWQIDGVIRVRGRPDDVNLWAGDRVELERPIGGLQAMELLGETCPPAQWHPWLGKCTITAVDEAWGRWLVPNPMLYYIDPEGRTTGVVRTRDRRARQTTR